jgi:hypothetical protein
MRMIVTLFVRPFVALAIMSSLAAPSHARKSEQKTSDISGTAAAQPSSQCNAAQMAPDGTWTLVPCHGVNGSTPAPQRTSAGSGGESSR